MIKGEVLGIVQQTQGGKLQTSDQSLSSDFIAHSPFIVYLKLDSTSIPEALQKQVSNIPAGAYGTTVIYTNDLGSIPELLQAIMLRIDTWLNYL
ncbi:hypothetical protein [Thalassotalea agarivorans]|uniref:Uncharacterized protein n=1 Tax=Thalassotalea agarivorans TaxID=349064 RepID=A0A1I0AKB2_THASX|nr:hypothetical protein [Thalassotalea agarivorans]SES94743.1 hypothetical protein SAMN05660429_00737 [Thalassotalea agarivorans]